ncbi:uncharacterized protein LTR77_006648 [Saxophila tyrrhenica]|uniref:Uncharacterized protein n=1 Tax=Saxophila tyrrhenica TaxID=1690608 RepID=A0AAV9P590_9PEZI|nr:hypothetical protein LTR77_006648 [Saxophila tyrrhenica]
MSYYGDDDYDYIRRRRPSPHRYRSDRRANQLLSPHIDGGGLHRSRSQGGAPVPVVNVYNDMIQDGSFRNNSRSPPSSRGSDHRSDYRGHGRLGDDLVDDFADLALENRRLRSRSRGRSDAGVLSRRDDLLEYELRDRDRRLQEIERREMLQREEDRMKEKYELQRVKEEAKRKADEEEAKAERKRIIDEYERRQREDEEDRKEEERRIREKIEREKKEAKEREEREWAEFLQKQKEKEAKEKAEKKAEEERVEDEMRKRLSKHGYTYDQIERMIKDKKDEPTTSNMTTTTTMTRTYGSHRPTYAKIHRDFISIDTLTYYDIPYEYDSADRNYIIILREMDKYETEVLFEHTRRLRAGKLLLEPPKKEKDFAWYRKRDRSSSRVKRVGILELSK